MAQNQYEGSGAVVYRGGGFCATEESKIVLEVLSAFTTFACCEIDFQIVIVRGDVGKLRHGGCKSGVSLPAAG